MSTATVTVTNPTTNQQSQELERPGRGIKPIPGLRVEFLHDWEGPHFGVLVRLTPELAIIRPDQDDSIVGNGIDDGDCGGVPWSQVRLLPDLQDGLDIATTPPTTPTV